MQQNKPPFAPQPVAAQKPTRGPAGGLTLLELLVVVAVIAMLSTIAIGSFGSSVHGQQAEAAARRLAFDINRARNHAMRAGIDVQLKFQLKFNRYVIDAFTDPDHEDEPYAVELTHAPYHAQIAVFGVGALTAAAGSTQTITFDRHGCLVDNDDRRIVLSAGKARRTVFLDAKTQEVIVK